MNSGSAGFATSVLDDPVRCIAEDVDIGENCEIGRHVVIETNVRIGDRVSIGDGAFIGEGSRIGDDCVIGARATLREHTWVGERVVIEAGAVLGSDGFGFAQRADGTQFKIPQVGIVEVGDDCRIGACATVDRATLGKTLLGERVEIGPLVMVGHNVTAGNDCRLEALSGVSGSTKLGKNVRIGPHAGLVGHLRVEEGCTIDSCTGVTKSLPKNTHLKGVFPAMAPALFDQQQELVNRLPGLIEQLERLERKTASAVQQPSSSILTP
jgi:UDP-3-O-[3-hydroxymyristoyl] glucosamine N-acyltransferase